MIYHHADVGCSFRLYVHLLFRRTIARAVEDCRGQSVWLWGPWQPRHTWLYVQRKRVQPAGRLYARQMGVRKDCAGVVGRFVV